MPRFVDAIGYLLELRDTVNEAWFHAVCDFTIGSTGAPPSDDHLNELWDYFFGRQLYKPMAAAVAPINAAVIPRPPSAFLEELSSFTGFKKLAPSLHIRFNKQLTLVFGKNGSGKSSLCQALKVLADPSAPTEPLHNVRQARRVPPAFSYRLRNNAAQSHWREGVGFGTEAGAIKYFDATVALRHSSGELEPSAVVEILAFRLESFEYARLLVTAFQRFATKRVQQETTQLQAEIDLVKQQLASTVDITGQPFDQWGVLNTRHIEQHLRNLVEFGPEQVTSLADLSRRLEQYKTASSEEGLRSLRARPCTARPTVSADHRTSAAVRIYFTKGSSIC
jgi:energy-coupling factor transporter ATP-binding protein EcfA2